MDRSKKERKKERVRATFYKRSTGKCGICFVCLFVQVPCADGGLVMETTDGGQLLKATVKAKTIGLKIR